jgi:type IV pilus assembly protein PilM
VPAGQSLAAVLPGVGLGREQPEKILICGGCANIPGAADVVDQPRRHPGEKGDPLGQMKISSKREGAGRDRSDATALLTACGLALRSFD